MKRKLWFLTTLVTCLTVAGCGGNTVPQEKYAEVVAERDSYKEELDRLKGNDSGEKKKNENVEKEETGKPESNSEELSEQIEVRECSMENSYGDAYYALVVKNNSDRTVSVQANAVAKDSEGNTIGAASSSGEAIGSGCEACLMNYFDDVEGNSTFEYTMSVKEDSYYESVIGDLTHEDSDTGEKVIVTCTNNGDKAAQFVEGMVLFLSGDNLVGYGTNYFTDDDNELKPGASIAKEFDFYEEGAYDRFEVYFTGRR